MINNTNTERILEYQHMIKNFRECCEKIENQNERYIHRINTAKKLLRRRLKDIEILKQRLDKYNDNWRSLPMVAPHPKRKIEQKRGPKPKPKPEGNVELPKPIKMRKRMKKNEDVPATQYHAGT